VHYLLVTICASCWY